MCEPEGSSFIQQRGCMITSDAIHEQRGEIRGAPGGDRR